MQNNWSVKKLGEVCAFAFGYPFKAEDFNESDKGLPVIRIGDIDKSKTDKFYAGKYDGKYLITRGNILIGLSGSIKISRWQGKGALLNQRIVKLYGFPSDISEDFIFYQLPFSLKELERQLTQGTVKNVLVPHLSNINVLIPTINIQKKIVERLDAIRKAQELCDQQIQKTEELFESILSQTFNNKNENTKSLFEVCDLVTDFVANGSFASLKENVKYKRSEDFAILLRLVDYSNGFKGEFVYVDEHAYNFLAKSKLKPGDLILSNVGANLGTVFKAPDLEKPMSLGPNAVLIRSNKLEDYLYFWFLSQIGKEAIQNIVTKTGQPKFNKTDLRSIKIPIPKIEEQQKIVEKLEGVQNYKKLLLNQKSLLKELFDSVLDKSMKEN